MRPAPLKLLYYCSLFLAVLLVFQAKFGLGIINPGHDGWLFGWGSDMAPDICTWQYYRYSPLFQGAPGTFSGYAAPQLIGVGNTNIIPVMAMPLKLFHTWLPEHFQHFGFFLLLCYLLQAFFADRLLRIQQVPLGYLRWAGVFLVLIAAPFLDRFNHLALCAHWLILASLCIYFSPKCRFKTTVFQFALLCLLAAMIHPYLVLFPFLIAFANGLKVAFKQKKGWLYLLYYPVAGIFGILAGFYISGVFSLNIDSGAASGFGLFNSNLNTFWNNIGKTNFGLLNLPSYKVEQFEGYAYLGLGMLLAWVLLLLRKDFYRMMGTAIRNYWPLFTVLCIALIYALGFKPSFNQHMLFDPGLEERTFLYRMASIFRSSGRYIWLPFYIMMIIPVVYLSRKKQLPAYGMVLLTSIVLILQTADLSKAMARSVSADSYKTGPNWPELVAVALQSSRVYTYPYYQRGIVTMDDLQYLTAKLAPRQIPISAGHLPRPDTKAMQRLMDTLQVVSEKGNWILDPGAIIITSRDQVGYFMALQKQEQAEIVEIGDYRVLFSPANHTLKQFLQTHGYHLGRMEVINVAEYLEQNKDHYTVIVSKDDAANALDSTIRKELSTYSKTLSELTNNESYALIQYKGKALVEMRKPKGENISLDYKLKDNGREVEIHLRATSGTALPAYFYMQQVDLGDLNRGLNIFVLDDSLQLRSRKYFDTYKTYYSSK